MEIKENLVRKIRQDEVIETVYWFWKNNMITLDDVEEFMEYYHGDWKRFIKNMDFEDKRIINK